MNLERDPALDRMEKHAHNREEVLSFIGASLRDGANDAAEGRLESIVFDDGKGHHVEHPISKDEAESIERSMWSAHNDMVFESLRSLIYNSLVEAGFDLENPPFDINVSLKRTEAGKSD
ncbi:MAG: hypothetical protein PHH01_00730 [Patescibacteria group bacterium]|nr:hypothetical protein [Patescibacteria group bacterium]